MKEVSENNPLFSEEMRLNMVNIDHPGKIADFIASILNVEKKDQQRILEMLNVRQRMETVLVFIKKEQEFQISTHFNVDTYRHIDCADDYIICPNPAYD